MNDLGLPDGYPQLVNFGRRACLDLFGDGGITLVAYETGQEDQYSKDHTHVLVFSHTCTLPKHHNHHPPPQPNGEQSTYRTYAMTCTIRPTVARDADIRMSPPDSEEIPRSLDDSLSGFSDATVIISASGRRVFQNLHCPRTYRRNTALLKSLLQLRNGRLLIKELVEQVLDSRPRERNPERRKRLAKVPIACGVVRLGKPRSDCVSA